MLKFNLLVIVVVGCFFGVTSRRPRVSYGCAPRGLWPRARVVGGRDAAPGEFPYQVSLQWVSPTLRFHTCGGAILNQNWVLTAARCILGLPQQEGSLFVVAGEHDFSRDDGTEQECFVETAIIHEKFQKDPAEVLYDIALLQLGTCLQFNKWVSAIALPAAWTDSASGTAALSGWGSTSNSNDHLYPSVLQTARLPIILNSRCERIYSHIDMDHSIMCTGPLSGRKAHCTGDTGSPLTMGGVVIGIASWRVVPCGQPGYPSVYTRVSYYISWINDIMTA